MKNKCDCYHIESKRRHTYHPITGQLIGHDDRVGVCWGTKEIDECSCGGDRTKCNFYPEVREKAKKELKRNEIVTNGDNIRSMSDKKLAKFLADLNGGGTVRCEQFLKWLKEEAE